MAGHYDADWDAIGMERPDVAFYRSLVPQTSGAIVDVAAGTGRVTIPVAEVAVGRTVYAVEPSPAMRLALRRNLEAQPGVDNVRAIEGRFGETGLPDASVGYAFSAFRSFQHVLTDDAQRLALMELHRIVRPDGLMAMDLFEAEDELRCNAEETEMARSPGRSPGTWRVRRDGRRYDPAEETMTVTMRWLMEDAQGDIIEELGDSSYSVRCLSRSRLRELLECSGWVDIRLYSDFRRTRLGSEPRDIIVIARRG